MYVLVLPTTPNVCSYTTLAQMNCQIVRVRQLILVLFPQNFFRSQAQFWHYFAEIYQKKMLKIHVAVWHRTYTSEFLIQTTQPMQ